MKDKGGGVLIVCKIVDVQKFLLTVSETALTPGAFQVRVKGPCPDPDKTCALPKSQFTTEPAGALPLKLTVVEAPKQLIGVKLKAACTASENTI